MSAHADRLDAEIRATERRLRRAVEAGRHDEVIAAQERLEGLTLGARLLFGDEAACYHVRHRFVGQDGRGVNVWECCACGDRYPKGATV